MCGGGHEVRCQDDFVYTAPSMYVSEDMPDPPLLGVNFVEPWAIRVDGGSEL